jgi:hypothetical protein
MSNSAGSHRIIIEPLSAHLDFNLQRRREIRSRSIVCRSYSFDRKD